MIKILHTADVHLDSPLRSLALRDAELREKVQTSSRTALTRIVETAISEDVAALLIAGDLFDGAERSARTAAFLMLQLERLRARGIRVFYIKGNHDAENPLTGELSLPDNVHVFDGRVRRTVCASGASRPNATPVSALDSRAPRKTGSRNWSARSVNCARPTRS